VTVTRTWRVSRGRVTVRVSVGSKKSLSTGGRDLLIGGAGADRIVGNEDDDVLIAGFTRYDADPTALAAIRSHKPEIELPVKSGQYTVEVSVLAGGKWTDPERTAVTVSADKVSRVTAGK
jgi:Ca2+-binding RTX toxin-like protein